MRLHQLDHPRGHRRTHPALRPRPVTDPFHHPTLGPLAEDLLHITKAHTEHRRQFAEATMTLRMRLEYLPAQIVLVGSRHMVVVAESRLFYITLSMISL